MRRGAPSPGADFIFDVGYDWREGSKEPGLRLTTYAGSHEKGRRPREAGRVHVAGRCRRDRTGHRLPNRGATALRLGIRDQTIDSYIKLDPEPRGVFEAIERKVH